MEKNTTLFLILSCSLFIISSAESCKPGSCDPNQGPQVRFPFRLQNRDPTRCGYPGFDLHCNAQNQTILTLPRAGDFIVDLIDYKRQSLFISDPGSCLPNRALNFSLSGSPFRPAYVTRFVFLNCSGSWEEYAASPEYYYYVPLVCLGGGNDTVLAGSPRGEVPATCRRMGDVVVPPWWRVRQPDEWPVEPKEAFEVGWSEPRCGECEIRGGVCGYKDKDGDEIGCSKSSGLSRRAKYGIIAGAVISAVLCMIGVGCYSCGMIKTSTTTVRNQHPSDSAFIQLPVIRAAGGLDLHTIDSYPKIVLGQSLRLPTLSDNICPICLCDYQSKETLRSIPECNHCFHVACIDEWLKLNATCPVCRKSPN